MTSADRQVTDVAGQRARQAHDGQGADRALAAHQRTLDLAAVLEHGQFRGDAGGQEVNLGDALAGLAQHLARLELDRTKMRPDELDVRAKGRQHEIAGRAHLGFLPNSFWILNPWRSERILSA
jgi:hypothetical protein